ncbi:putative tRNA (guanine-N(7)-)-methyltransferase [Halobacteriovorax marinus SJ]|uniref:tRNA (guanine(46)-N(7))-methyltransferase n=2 Tax=Halobacteriovorax marinus TaxID=97084 RepID=E1WYD7_HALMS|nr:putative tRNA (guanine-N(7)-)-methyltransferase [Halobacteriovorax marinus SJ]
MIDMSMRKFNPQNIPTPKFGEFNLPNMPLDIEIGCGVGLHPIQYSMANPDRYLVAIEHTTEKFEKFKRRFEKHGCPKNLLPVHENGISWVAHLLEKESVDRFFFLFPNPNPKPSQQNKRFHAMPFMEKVIECLKLDGTVHMATNESFYAEECLDFMTNVWKLKCVEHRMITKDDNFIGRTHFERKYLERGQEIHDFIFKKEKSI